MAESEMNPLVSIIVPAYNVAEFLPRCLESILASQNGDFEVLLINDGSTDGTSAICDSYAAKDQRIRVFHKANGGVSSARNVGLDNARGQWLAFIDSDDEITPDFLTIPDNYLDCDVVQKGYVELGNTSLTHKVRNNILSKKKDIENYFVYNRNNALWDKLISKSVVYGIHFDIKTKIGEDFIFFLQILDRLKIWGFSDIGLYRYWHRPNSAMHRVMPDERLDLVIKQINNILGINNIHKNIGQKILVHTYFPHIWNNRKHLSTQSIDRIKDEIDGISLNLLFQLPGKTIMKFFLLKYFLIIKKWNL